MLFRSEQRDGDRQKREVIVEDHREEPREGKFQNECRQRRETQSQVELRPADGFRACGGRANSRQSSTVATADTAAYCGRFRLAMASENCAAIKAYAAST